MKKNITMNLSLFVFTMSLGLASIACKSAEPTTVVETNAAYDELLTLMQGRTFRIDVDAVQPFNTAATTQVLNNLMSNTGNTAGRIDVSGAGHYLEMREGTVKGSLPYFGELRQGGMTYGNANGGIAFEGTPEDLDLLGKPDKNRVVIKFKVNDHEKRTEHYEVAVTAFPGGSADIRIFSSHRSTIAYSGNWSRIEDNIKSN